MAFKTKAGYHEGATFFELEAFAEAVRGKRAVPVMLGGAESNISAPSAVSHSSWQARVPRTARDGKMAVLMGGLVALASERF